MRSSKLTPELQESICEAIERGNTYENAARLNSISPATLYNWRLWGKQGKDGYLEFFEAIELSRARAEDEMVGLLKEAAMGQEIVETIEVYRYLPDGPEIDPKDLNAEHLALIEKKTKTSIKKDTSAAKYLIEQRNRKRWGRDGCSDEEPLSEVEKKVIDKWMASLVKRADAGDLDALSILVEKGILKALRGGK